MVIIPISIFIWRKKWPWPIPLRATAAACLLRIPVNIGAAALLPRRRFIILVARIAFLDSMAPYHRTGIFRTSTVTHSVGIFANCVVALVDALFRSETFGSVAIRLLVLSDCGALGRSKRIFCNSTLVYGVGISTTRMKSSASGIFRCTLLLKMGVS
jgi:hypothetical protein